MARFRRINDTAKRETELLGVALQHAALIGYTRLTRESLADKASVSPGTISRYFGTMDQLRRAVMRAAIEQGIADIVAQGIAAGDPDARTAPQELKDAAVALLAAR